MNIKITEKKMVVYLLCDMGLFTVRIPLAETCESIETSFGWGSLLFTFHLVSFYFEFSFGTFLLIYCCYTMSPDNMPWVHSTSYRCSIQQTTPSKYKKKVQHKNTKQFTNGTCIRISWTMHSHQFMVKCFQKKRTDMWFNENP